MDTAGCVFKAQFKRYDNNKKLKAAGYIDYMDRAQAKDSSEYLEYMGNSEKSEGVFTATLNSLTKEEKKQLKEQYKLAESKGSNLQKYLFTFKDEWLKENGLMADDRVLRSDLLMEYTRAAMITLQKNENMENFIWSGAIHYNTEHIHIHLSMIDPAPSWIDGEGRCFMYNGKLEQRGKLKPNTLNKTKSTFINLAIGGKELNENINKIIRDDIVINFKVNDAMKESMEFKNRLEYIVERLPADKSMWKYNMNILESIRADIDELTDWFISNNYNKEFKSLKDELNSIEYKYAQSYGNSYKQGKFTNEKIDELYSRFGNAILSECKKLSEPNPINGTLDISTSKKNAILSDLKYNIKGSLFDMSKALNTLKKSLKKDIQSLKNQAIYEYNEKMAELEVNSYGR
jgi:putative uncharacterized protein (fragment)